MLPRTLITHGPNSTAPSPVPVGWLLDPATLGSLRALRTKQKAPASPSSSLISGLSVTSRLMRRKPRIQKGIVNRYQNAAHCHGTVSYTHLTLPTIYSV